MSSVEWPAPGREALLDAEPALAHLIGLADAVRRSGSATQLTDAVVDLVGRFCGPSRDVRPTGPLVAKHERARRALGSEAVWQAVVTELRGSLPEPSAQPAQRMSWVGPTHLRVKRGWVG
jgi:hypothetical protein